VSGEIARAGRGLNGLYFEAVSGAHLQEAGFFSSSFRNGTFLRGLLLDSP
jgi:hypothetical protein